MSCESLKGLMVSAEVRGSRETAIVDNNILRAMYVQRKRCYKLPMFHLERVELSQLSVHI
jgi:hypothetical protein